MGFHLLSANLTALVLNMAAGSIAIATVSVLVARVTRGCSRPLQHGLLLAALLTILACPILISVSLARGNGLWQFTVPKPASKTDATQTDPRMPVDPSSIKTPSPDTQLSATTGNQKSIESAEQARPKSEKPATVAVPAKTAAANNQPTAWQLVQTTCTCFAVVWLLVAARQSADVVRAIFMLRRLRRSLCPNCDPRLSNGPANAMAHLIDGIPVYESDLAPAPLVLGWFKPVIVMPAGLSVALDDDELATVMTHEVAHAARRDTVVALFQQLTLAWNWWNPCVRIISRRLSHLREELCDDRVIELFGDGRPLANALIKVAEWSCISHTRVHLVATLLDDLDDLSLRVARLAGGDGHRPTSTNWFSRIVVVLFGAILLVLAAIPVLRNDAVAAPDDQATRETPSPFVMAVRAVDGNGNRIKDVKVGLLFGPDQVPEWQQADSEGIARITTLPRLPKYVYVMVRAPGFAPMRAFWWNGNDIRPDPLPDEFEFRMTKSITVGGEVVDEQGESIAGASVLLSAEDGHKNAAERAEVSLYREPLRTDESGRWECDLAPETIQSATMTVTHPDHAKVPINNLSQDQRIPELRKGTHRWVLKRGFLIRGRVVDAEDQPVANAKLALSELNSIPSDGPFTATDDEGHYSFGRVSPFNDRLGSNQRESFMVTVAKPGFAPVLRPVPGFGGEPMNDSTVAERIMNFTLEEGNPLVLHVVDSSEKPVAGASVFINDWQGTRSLNVLELGIPRKTDEEGHWVWKNAPTQGMIEFGIQRRDFAYNKHRIQLIDEDKQKEIMLSRTQVIVGRVTDAATGQPIDEFIIEQAFEKMSDDPDGLWWTERTRGTNGTYRHQPPVPPSNGSLSYRAVAEGYEQSAAKSIRYEEGETEVNFELKKKAEQPAVKPQKNLAKWELEAQERLKTIQPEFGKVYYLNEGEVLRHVPRPLDEDLRRRWMRAFFSLPDTQKQETAVMYLQWKEGIARWKGAGVGAPSSEGASLESVLYMLDVAHSQFLQADTTLRQKIITGDWVFDPQASAEDIVNALQAVLRKEWKIPVTMKFREVEKEVCVVRGNWGFKPISDKHSEVQIYGIYLDQKGEGGGGTESFDKFLKAAGSWIDLPMVNEVTTPPKKWVSWHFNMESPTTKAQLATAHNPDLVLGNLEAQTNLEFKRERRKVRMLFIDQGK